MGNVLRTQEVGEVWLVWDGFGGCTFDLFATEADAQRAFAWHDNPKRMEIKRLSLRSSAIETRATQERRNSETP